MDVSGWGAAGARDDPVQALSEQDRGGRRSVAIADQLPEPVAVPIVREIDFAPYAGCVGVVDLPLVAFEEARRSAWFGIRRVDLSRIGETPSMMR